MGVVVGLLFGAGLFNVWSATWVETKKLPRTKRSSAVKDLLIHAGMTSVTPGALLVLSIGCFAVVGFVAVAVTRTVPIAATFATMAGMAPLTLVRARARKRRSRLQDAWPEVVDHLSSGVRAGLSLPEALSQLATRGPQELRPQFTQFAREYRASGRFDDCLSSLKERMADPIADRIVESLRLAREVGGTDLGLLLRTLALFLREDIRIRGELEARQSWTVAGARIAVAGPWLVLGFLSIRPETAAAYNSSAGVVVLLIGAGCCVLAYKLMLRIGQLPQDVRVLQ